MSAAGVASEIQRDVLPEGSLWGCDVVRLHDLYWASKRVEVVRLGSDQRVTRRGPSVYMLIGADDLVDFQIGPVLRQNGWLRVAGLRVRIRDRSEDRYAEHVNTDEDGRVRSIERDYSRHTRSTTRVILTREPELARVWAISQHRRGAIRVLREMSGSRPIFPVRTEGRVFDATTQEGRDRAMASLCGAWQDVSSVLPEVYEFEHQVWLHESVEVADDARLVGPLWVGAGVRIEPGEVVAGPGTISDERPAAVPVRVDWTRAMPPGWRLVPRVRRRRLRRVTKRLFDIAFALAVLLFTMPIYPIVMLIIWREDGRPIFFAHTRQTLQGRSFPCLKFRTMRKDAEKLKAELVKQNQADGPQFFIENDPRLLRCGGTLRRFQIDELPQFINVLLGHMSVVGPRPSPDKENQFCPAWREARLSVRPGVTGLWQVRRTREPQTDFQEWIRYDLEYVQHESWKLDLWIIYQTVRQIVFKG
ncbi:MAG: sugar transferase [Planctomycetota bacterium]